MAGQRQGPAPEVVTSPWAAWTASRNDKARARRRWRDLNTFDAVGPRGTLGGHGHVVSFAGNDYLGLSAHPAVVAAAREALERWGTGAGASRLVTGTRPVHAELEAQLATWKATEAALVFPTGFAANLGVLSTLAGPGVLVCSDAANHASIIDGCRLAGALGARVEVYPHLDVGVVEAMVGAHHGRAIVVSDSVFSMDGDAAPVADLARVCARHGALLVLDEAHAVLGPDADGLACDLLRVGTLSKTLGSLGGFVAGSRALVELLVNRCRPFIYTTALSPADAAAAGAAVRILRSREGTALLARLRAHARRLKPGTEPDSPIFPVVLGAEQAAIEASSALLSRGLWVPAIRPPTVPPGTSRLRVSLSAAHTDDEVGALLASLDDLGLSV